MSKFVLGEKVWWARLESKPFRIPCPDCCGQKFVTVILGDGKQVTVQCEGCKHGFEGSRGYNEVWQYAPFPEFSEVRRVETKFEDGIEVIEYGLNQNWCVREKDIFLSVADAQKRAEQKAAEQSERTLADFYKRERPERSWAWNATYHRSAVKNAQKDLAYHTAKLDEAKKHVKEKNDN